MTKTNEHLSNLEAPETFNSCGKNHAFKPKIRFGKRPSKPDLIVSCLLCDIQFPIKYILPKKQYSSKNLWNYWTGKKTGEKKYLCNACLMRLHHGKMTDWITDKDKVGDFYQYVWRGQFK